MDKAIRLASMREVIFVSYGDMLRVPGSSSDLFRTKAAGGDVRIAYSPTDALRLARQNPGRQVVFFGIGFETTAPAHALALKAARREGLKNFSMLVSHVLVPPAIRGLMESPDCRVQAFIAPGHVCTVMGYWQYEELAARYRIPIVVAGFEPVDLVEAVLKVVTQLEEGRAEVENQYVRSVNREGNRPAQQAIDEVFEICDRKWRGIGRIPLSGYRIREEFAAWDAERVFDLEDVDAEEPVECISSLVLQGIKKPVDCPAFGTRCTPAQPLGAPMVSAEGACSAYFQYRRHGARG